MLQRRNTIIVLAIFVSHLHLVSTTSCFCTLRDFVLPVFSENNKNEAKSMVFTRKQCFVGRTEGNLFCPDNQSFCLNMENLYSIPCDEVFESNSNISSQFHSVSLGELERAYTHDEHLYQRRFLVDRHWGDWGSWQECIADACGKYGIQTRERLCLPKNGDLGKCPGDAVELNQCFNNCTNSTGATAIGWTDWSTWSSCETLCNSSTSLATHMSNRTRVCQDVSTCVGDEVEQKPCAVDGKWSEWGNWSKCTNDNFTHRVRTCDNPAPTCGGKQCDGNRWIISTCTIEFGWTAWTNWSSCINTEGLNFKLRNRTCKGGVCDGEELDYEPCLKTIYTAWSYWSQCSVTCGNGVRTRDRLCIDSKSLQPLNESFCVGDSVMTDRCPDQMCQDSNTSVWSDWAAWSNCDPPCDSGSSTRTRTCLITNGCQGLAVENTSCSRDLCNIDGGWAAWEEWNQCSQFQNYNIIARLRHCTHPYPKNSGKDCIGDEYAVDTCKDESSWGPWLESGHCYKQGDDGNTTGLQFRNRTCHVGLSNAICQGHNEDWQPCTLQGVWSMWGNWSACSKTCDIGVQQRHRYCSNAIDLECAGSGIENQTCHEIKNCPVDGKFSEWSAWSDCPVTCDGGPKSRNRYCDNPKPRFGGKSCTGSLTEAGVCNTQPCPVDGHLTDWGHWNPCSVSCGNGTKVRDRTCTNPQPSFGGKACDGHTTDSDSCIEALCNVDGAWGLWEAWTQCTCQHSHVRKRLCDSPTPVANGASCVGEGTQTSNCTIPDASLKCPVNGAWSDWSQWGTICSVTCGHGTVSRKRECANPKPANGGASCFGEGLQEKECVSISCPVDGAWSSWSAWSHCGVTCANGTQFRNRTCNKPEPADGGRDCEGNKVDSMDCAMKPCPIDGIWSDWQAWSSWDVTCARGSRSRARKCDNPAPVSGGHNCPGDVNDFESKDLVKCPVDGGWSDWSAWFGCSTSCGPGTNKRYRACNNPVPKNHGQICLGDFVDTTTCNEVHCPVDGNWADWGSWGSCSVTCSNGTRAKTRNCSNPSPQFNGKQCPGISTESDECSDGYCPVDGSWTDWSAWNPCSVTCGDGYKIRNRSCDKPSPKYGGLYCLGHSTGNSTCNYGHCPIDGNWGSWFAWESCSKSCGDGTKLRHRQCDNPVPQYGGANCTGTKSESDACNKGPCPIDGMWGVWVPWSKCTGGCTTGKKQRYRSCDSPTPLNGGAFCSGAPFETESCIPNNCTVDGNWGTWMAWESCSASCADGIKLRHRTCDNPTPQYGGSSCSGINEESGTCNKGPCPIDGLWGSWQPWSHCSGNCTSGNKQRFRSCDSPTPLHGGTFCPGVPSEMISCLPQNCTASTPSTTFDAAATSSATRSNTGTSINTATTTSSPGAIGDDTATSSTISTASSSATFTNASIISTTTTTAGPPIDFKCYVCDTTMPEFCVALKREETCHQPYCINEFTNLADGTKQLNRRCGTKTECDKDWWKSTSDTDKCTMFDVSQTVTNYIHCTFCCVDELCNEQIIPPHKSLYRPPTP